MQRHEFKYIEAYLVPKVVCRNVISPHTTIIVESKLSRPGSSAAKHNDGNKRKGIDITEPIMVRYCCKINTY